MQNTKAQPLAKQMIALIVCGEGGIRTLGTVARTTVFETATIDRSATSPEDVAFDAPGSARLRERDAKIMELIENMERTFGIVASVRGGMWFYGDNYAAKLNTW